MNFRALSYAFQATGACLNYSFVYQQEQFFSIFHCFTGRSIEWKNGKGRKGQTAIQIREIWYLLHQRCKWMKQFFDDKKKCRYKMSSRNFAVNEVAYQHIEGIDDTTSERRFLENSLHLQYWIWAIDVSPYPTFGIKQQIFENDSCSICIIVVCARIFYLIFLMQIVTFYPLINFNCCPYDCSLCFSELRVSRKSQWALWGLEDCTEIL